MVKAIRFDQKQPATGLPWRNLGISQQEVLSLRMVQVAPWLIPVFAFMGVKTLMKQSQKSLWHSGGSCAVLSFRQTISAEEKALASMEVMRFILALTEAGFAIQPSTLSTEVLNQQLKPNKNLQTEAGLSIDTLFEDSNAVRTSLGLENREIIWLLRIGRPTQIFPENARTCRRPLSDLLS